MIYQRSQQKRSGPRKNPLVYRGVLAAVCLVILASVGVAIIHHFHTQKPRAITASPDTKAITGNKNSSEPSVSQSNISGSQPGDTKHPGADDSQLKLSAPVGTFANIYKAGPHDQMTSDCGTNSGATCQIIFTSGTVTRSLPAQLTDRGGGTAWTWTPSSIGLTAGTWHITAKAVLGSQTKTTSNDPLTLEITP